MRWAGDGGCLPDEEAAIEFQLIFSSTRGL